MTLYGATPAEAGRILLEGREVRLRHPRQALARGIGLVNEDRKHLGLLLERPIRENVSISSLDLLSAFGWVRAGRERERVTRQLDALSVRAASPEQRPRDLSGGNQQKVLLARALLRSARVLILDEPTRGIDVGAKQEIYHLINALAAQGVAILMISSELPEVLGMSDRVLVMRGGRLVGELDRTEARPERVMEIATGGS
jgi:ABC-type sugar transport system ATPase subunit